MTSRPAIGMRCQQARRSYPAECTRRCACWTPSYDGVLHFAARSLVAESVLHPELYWANNVVGSIALLDAMRQHNVPRIVFSSTAATYGVADTMPITEDTPARPITAYGQCKLAVDHALDGYARAHGIAAVSLRYFNLAGGYGHLGERHQRRPI
jgi:UDP-glucose 4-epimerase